MRILLTLLLVGAPVLAGCLASGPPSDSSSASLGSPTDYPVPAVPGVDAARTVADLRDFVTAYGERADNVPTHLGARDALAEAFGAAGLEVWRQPFTTGIPQENIAGIHWGVDRDTWVVVASHYDTTSDECALPGALPGSVNPPACPLRFPTASRF